MVDAKDIINRQNLEIQQLKQVVAKGELVNWEKYTKDTNDSAVSQAELRAARLTAEIANRKGRRIWDDHLEATKRMESRIEYLLSETVRLKTEALESGRRDREGNTNETVEAAVIWWGRHLETGDAEAFLSSLSKSVTKDLVEFGLVRLKVDYDPCPLLLRAVTDAGVRCSGMFSARGILPTKTTMVIRMFEISVKHGYGAEYEEVSVL